MGIFLEGLFIAYEQRTKDGKPDGFTVAVAAGVESFKVKIDDNLFVSSGVSSFALADPIRISVRVRGFRDAVYFIGTAIERMGV